MNSPPSEKSARRARKRLHWYEPVSKDPHTCFSAEHFADRRHFLANVINRSSTRQNQPQRVAVDDRAMARHISDSLYMERFRHFPGASTYFVPASLARWHSGYTFSDIRDLGRKFPYAFKRRQSGLQQLRRTSITSQPRTVSQLKGSCPEGP